jgi:WD40 repeat protein/energy-coupling factor transporter ATP-binding protein EcfA2
MPEHQIQAKLPFKQSHAFLIGIDEYQHITPLKTAERDARLIGRQLEKHHGFQAHYLMGKEATLEGIRELLHKTIPEVANETGAGPNRILLYFACHGYARDSDNKPQGFIAPWDAQREGFEKLLPMEEVHDALGEEKINCRHGLLILDCCFAGAFKWSNNSRHGGFALPKTIHHSLFLQFTSDPAWQVITSSSSDQEAADLINHLSLGHRDDGKWKDSPFVQQFNWQDFSDEEDQPIDISRHSPFALALFIALRGEGDRIMKGGRGDGIITGQELHGYLRHWVELVTMAQKRRQTPLIIDLPRHDKGEFVFLHPKHPAFLPPDPGRNPYKGLFPFQEGDEKFFFGRDKVVSHIIAELDKPSLLVLTGPAGSGKTSLTQAGIVPLVRAKEWAVLPVLPYSFPQLDMQLQALDKESDCLLIIDDFEQLLATAETGIEQWEDYLAELLNHFTGLRILLLVRTDFELYYSSTRPSSIDNDLTKSWWQLWENGKYRLPPLTKKELRDIIVLPARQAVLFFESDALVNELVNGVYLAPGALPLLSYFLSTLFDTYKKSHRTDRTFSQQDIEDIGGLIGALQKRATDAYDSMSLPEQMMMRFLLLRMVKFENGRLVRRKVPFVRLDKIPDSWIKNDFHIWESSSEDGAFIYHELDFPSDFDDELLNKVINKLDKEEKLIIITNNNEETQQLFVEPIHDALITFWPLAQQWFYTVGADTIMLQRQLWQSVKDRHALDLRANVIRVAQRDVRQDLKSTSLLWDNNPKLMQIMGAVIDSIIREKKQTAQEQTTDLPSHDFHFLDPSTFEGLSPEDKEAYQSLLFVYQNQGDSNSIDNIKMIPRLSRLSANLASLIIHQNRHWLNHAEVKFLLDSWYAKQANIQSLIRQRDEAQALAREAQAAAWAAKGQMYKAHNPTLGLHYAYAGYSCLPNEETIGALNSLSSARPYYKNIIAINTEPKQRGQLTRLASSPTDPHLILSGCSDGFAKLWDIDTGKCLQVFDDNKGRNISVKESPSGRLVEVGGNYGIISVDFSADGTLALTGCNDGSTVIWEVKTGRKRGVIQAPAGEEKYLGAISIQDISPVKVDYPREHPNYTFAHFLDEANTILTISPFGLMQEWNSESQSENRKYTFPDDNAIKRQSTVICTAVSANGRYIALGLKQTRGTSADDNSIVIVDRDKPDLTSTVLLSSKPVAGKLLPICLCFDSSARFLYAGLSDGCIKVYSVPSGRERLHIKAFSKPVRSILLTKKDRRLYAGSDGHDVKIWNARTGYGLGELRGGFKGIHALISCHDERYIAHGYLDRILLWQQDQQASQAVSSFEVGRTDVSTQEFLPAEQLILSPDSRMIAGLQLDNGTLYYTFYNLDGQLKKTTATSRPGLDIASFSPDSQYFIACYNFATGTHEDENPVHLYHLKSRKDPLQPVMPSGYSREIAGAIAISNKASFMLASRENTFELTYLDEADKKPLSGKDRDRRKVEEIVLSNKQQQFLVRTDHIIQLWNMLEDKLELAMNYYPKNESTPVCIAFDKQERYIFAGYSDYSIRQWEKSPESNNQNRSYPIQLNPVRTLRGHSEAVVSVAISDDGKYLLSGSDDGTLRLWDISNGHPLQTIPPYREPLSPEQEQALEDDYERDILNPMQGIHFVGFTDKDRLLIAGYKNGTVRCYDNILYRWPRSCYQLPKKSRSRLKIPEDIKFPK